MLKRGQISLFIIIGFVILILVSGVLLISNYLSKQDIEETIIFIPSAMGSFVENCFQEVSKEAMVYVSLQGGYFYVIGDYNDQIIANIPYYFDYGEENVPTKEMIEQEMGNYIVRKLPVCFADFAIFKDQGLIVEEPEEMVVTVDLNSTSSFELYYPLSIAQEDSITTLDEIYMYDIAIDFNNVYSILTEIVEEQELNPNYVPIGFISASAKQNNYEFELSYLDDDVVVYSLVFDRYLIDLENYVFIFGARYNWSHLTTTENVPEILVEDQHCYIGDICRYNLNIYNEDLTFEDHTNLFDISEQGLIEFVPEESDLGLHNTLVKVSNEAGAEKYLTIEFEILSLTNSTNEENEE